MIWWVWLYTAVCGCDIAHWHLVDDNYRKRSVIINEIVSFIQRNECCKHLFVVPRKERKSFGYIWDERDWFKYRSNYKGTLLVWSKIISLVYKLFWKVKGGTQFIVIRSMHPVEQTRNIFAKDVGKTLKVLTNFTILSRVFIKKNLVSAKHLLMYLNTLCWFKRLN